jgi:hypothetical protein
MIKSIGVLLADIHYLIPAQVIMPLAYLKIRRACAESIPGQSDAD